MEQFEYWGIALTLIAYGVGLFLKQKCKAAWCNPILVAFCCCVVMLLLGDIEYSTYQTSTAPLTVLLTPATVALAVSLHRQINLLKKNLLAILVSVCLGVCTSMAVILGGAMLFSFEHTLYVSLLPKSITTAIGICLSQEMGGVVSITVIAILITGISGNILIPALCKACKITEPIAVGLAIGTASHVIGTTKACEIGETEGAMSSVAIVISGLLTVLAAPVFAGFL